MSNISQMELPPNLPTHGRIRVCGQARGFKYPEETGWTVVPAWSRGASPWKQLSPFTIGPVEYIEDGVPCTAIIFENFWHAHKVFLCVDEQKQDEWRWPEEVHASYFSMVSEDYARMQEVKALNVEALNVEAGNVEAGNVSPPDFTTKAKMIITANITPKWYVWRNALLAHRVAVRRPNGKNIPLFARWQGRNLGLVESRKEIYIPYYQALLRKHNVYLQLLALVQKGRNIIIVEPDGPSPGYYHRGVEVSIPLLEQLQSCENQFNLMEIVLGIERASNYALRNPDVSAILRSKYHAYGHGYVIALTLLQDLAALARK